MKTVSSKKNILKGNFIPGEALPESRLTE